MSTPRWAGAYDKPEIPSSLFAKTLCRLEFNRQAGGGIYPSHSSTLLLQGAFYNAPLKYTSECLIRRKSWQQHWQIGSDLLLKIRSSKSFECFSFKPPFCDCMLDADSLIKAVPSYTWNTPRALLKNLLWKTIYRKSWNWFDFGVGFFFFSFKIPKKLRF